MGSTDTAMEIWAKANQHDLHMIREKIEKKQSALFHKQNLTKKFVHDFIDISAYFSYLVAVAARWNALQKVPHYNTLIWTDLEGSN